MKKHYGSKTVGLAIVGVFIVAVGSWLWIRNSGESNEALTGIVRESDESAEHVEEPNAQVDDNFLEINQLKRRMAEQGKLIAALTERVENSNHGRAGIDSESEESKIAEIPASAPISQVQLDSQTKDHIDLIAEKLNFSHSEKQVALWCCRQLNAQLDQFVIEPFVASSMKFKRAKAEFERAKSASQDEYVHAEAQKALLAIQVEYQREVKRLFPDKDDRNKIFGR